MFYHESTNMIAVSGAQVSSVTPKLAVTEWKKGKVL
jgi:hypothetical protein